MEADALQEAARHCAEALPAVTIYSFAHGWEAASIRSNWFMLLTEVPAGTRVRDARILAGQPVVIVKSSPDDAAALREAYADITVGYHMNKRHWITLVPGDELDERMVEELVTDAYRLVAGGLPEAPHAADPS